MSGRLLCIALLAALSAAAQESPNRVLTLDGDGHVHYQDFILFADLLDHNGGPAGKVRALLAERFALPTTLRPNFPNPFNASTTLVYALAAAGPVALIVYDIMGQEIRRLADARQAAGVYRFTWDGRDERGTRVSSGHYRHIAHAQGPKDAETALAQMKRRIEETCVFSVFLESCFRRMVSRTRSSNFFDLDGMTSSPLSG